MNKDWTQVIIPRTVVNENLAGVIDPRLQTTDYVTIPSREDYLDPKNPLRIKAMSDFAHRVHDFRIDEGVYRLRNPRQCVHGGAGVESDEIQNAPIGLAPCISLQLPADYNMEQLIDQLQITERLNNHGQKYYSAKVGEYPRSWVSILTGNTLHGLYEKYDHQAPLKSPDDFHCTGRLFTTPVANFSDSKHLMSKQYAEYSYNGKKYVIDFDVFGGAGTWYEVEPIEFVIKNYDEVARGKAKQMDLESAEIVLARIPFHVNKHAPEATLWQNSVPRAFLNGADARQQDGDASVRLNEPQWDFSQGGFLQQAFNLTRGAVREYTVPSHEECVPDCAFAGCQALEKIVIPAHVKSIGVRAFEGCEQAQLWFELSERSLERFAAVFQFASYTPVYAYVPKTTDHRWLVLARQLDQRLDQDYECYVFENDFRQKFFKGHFSQNFIQLNQWKNEHKIKFIPPAYVMKIFPSTEMANFFVNNNHKRWAELIRTLHLDLLADNQKNHTLADLMKIYYALGGFSTNQGARDKAFNYVAEQISKLKFEQKGPEVVDYLTNVVSTLSNDKPTEQIHAEWRGNEIHNRFSRLILNGPYNPTFAQFFMKYYHEDADFMKFDFGWGEEDFLGAAHNHFAEILAHFPNRVVNGNTERDLLTPEFVAVHSLAPKYNDVDKDNEQLAETVGLYGYDEEQFNKIQDIFNLAKTVKDDAVIRADVPNANHGITFRVLAKDDPLGFVIGDITNCCQHIGGAGEDCVCDGYTNPHAGFLVFETADKKILGQAYVWYDPETYTVCYDNIEIPNKVLDELKQGEKHDAALSMSNLMQAVINSADAIMTTMNRNGTKVERVTVGEGYNDLKEALQQHYSPVNKPARHRGYTGYTDAREQYLIRTIDQVQNKLTTLTANTSADLLKGATKPTDNAERTLPTL